MNVRYNITHKKQTIFRKNSLIKDKVTCLIINSSKLSITYMVSYLALPVERRNDLLHLLSDAGHCKDPERRVTVQSYNCYFPDVFLDIGYSKNDK